MRESVRHIGLVVDREGYAQNIIVHVPPLRRRFGQVPNENCPKFWMDEITGRLKPIVKAYYDGQILSNVGCALLRAYLDQWIQSPVWDLPPIEAHYRVELAKLRKAVRSLRTTADIREWLAAADSLGIEPL